MTTAAVRPRPGDAMKVRFPIAARSDGDSLPAEGACRVGEMRRRAKKHLDHCGLTDMSDDVALIVSELITNAILHSRGTQVTLVISLQDGLLDITVHDEMPGRPVVQHPSREAEHGRGLQLVQAITAERKGDWGTSDGGATTWCALPVAQDATDASPPPCGEAAPGEHPVPHWDPPMEHDDLACVLRKLRAWKPFDGGAVLDDASDVLDDLTPPEEDVEALAHRLRGYLRQLADIAIATNAQRLDAYTVTLIERAGALQSQDVAVDHRLLRSMGWVASELLDRLVEKKCIREAP